MSQPTPPPAQFADPKSAKAQAKAEQAYRKASRPFYKKKRFILLAVIALIVIIAIATSGGGSGSGGSSSSSDGGGSSSDASAKAVGLNESVRDGKFEFTVNGVDCSKTTLGTDPISTQANGTFCLVSVHVQNIGDEAQTLDSMSQVAYDAQGKKYSTDTEAAFYLENAGDALFNQLNPGTSVDGTLVYDVPTGTTLTKLELHDSAFSGGVTVNLG
jgi:Domain of unknown function (DUF4352)